ncbi:MAG: hypothetical protein HYZ28_00715 [Myxococcales bacterium]|nr:hypothetical protein [Myxococcales bacterium]
MLQLALVWILAGAEKAPEQKTLEQRVGELEREIQRLKLSEPEPSGEPVQPPSPVSSPNVFNPTVTVFGNGLYRYDDREIGEGAERSDNHFNLREVELDFRAAVDPFADGVLITAFESELPGEFEAAVEEGYVTIKRLPLPVLDEPPLGLKLKVGRFRTEVGRFNRLHLHDLPQMTRPLVLEEFLGEEGFIGNGLSAQLFLPTPFDEDSTLELTAQALTGGGVAVAPGPAQSLGLVGNLRWFRALAGSHHLDLSLIFHYGRTEPGARLHSTTYGADFLYRWKPLRGGEFHSFLLGGQLFYSRRAFLEPVDNDGDGLPDGAEPRTASPLGTFAFAQVQLSRTAYLGVRWDDTASISDSQVRRRAVTGYLSWYASEFLRFRLGYERRWSDFEEEDGRNSAFAELNLVFGAHPPEPFWVNR